MEEYLNHYRAKLDRVIDGDSVRLFITLGLGIMTESVNCRLYQVDAPERGQEGYEEAISLLYSWLMDNELIVLCDDRDKYGRPLVYIFVNDDETSEWICVNDQLILHGFVY